MLPELADLDLVHRKLLPGLFHLATAGLMPGRGIPIPHGPGTGGVRAARSSIPLPQRAGNLARSALMARAASVTS